MWVDGCMCGGIGIGLCGADTTRSENGDVD